MEIRKNGDTETGRQGDMETWRHGDMETRRHGDMGTWRHGDIKTKTEAQTFSIIRLLFVICPLVEEETNGSYPSAHRLHGLAHL